MSEQIHQNQNILTEQEMRARDDAIFDTVAEFRNDLENPPLPQVPEYKGIGADDTENKVDVDAIFDNRKSEISQSGTGRHRKAYSEEAETTAAKAGMQYRAERVAKQMAEGVELQGLAMHRGNEEFAATAMAKEGKKADKKEAPEAPEFIPELDSDEKYENYFDPAKTEAAEAAVRDMPRRSSFGADPEAEPTSEPTPAPEPAAAPVRGRHRRTPRVMADGEIGANHTGSIRVAGGESSSDSDAGRAIGPDGRLRIGTPVTDEGDRFTTPLGLVGEGEGEGSSEPVVVTPEARRRDRIVARLGKLANVDQIRSGLREARAEVSDEWRQFVQARAARKAASTSGEDGFWARHGDKLTVAAAGIGVAAVAAGLGIQHSANEAPAPTAASASPHASESAKPFGPQAPKTSETPTPSTSSSTAKETPKAKPTARPTTSPSAIPHMPGTWDTKPPVQEPKGPTAERQQTKETDHESISFTTKDGKVVRATATLKSGGSIFEAGHDAGLTDTEVANAVNKAGISSQRAEQLPVGQQINFDQQADGSYVVHLQQS